MFKTSNEYDLVIVGGGMAGSALARKMAEHGSRVLVLEKEKEFKDRVRGDAMAPWGVQEARDLGIDRLLLAACGHELPWVHSFIGRTSIEQRHLPTTTRCRAPELAFYHPAMQEILLQSAADAGAEVVRNATAGQLQRGETPTIAYRKDRHVQVAHARVVVGADGRNSQMRRLGGFVARHDPPERYMAGVLLEGMQIRQDTCYSVFNPHRGQLVALFPQGNDRVRAYFSYPNHAHGRLQGPADVAQFMEHVQRSGAPAEWFAGARAIGPLASFASDDHWVPHPYRDGVVLIGDAAATNDPMCGQGLSLTLRDVRVLAGHLAATDDWNAACHAYAQEHDDYFHVVHIFSHWFESIFYQTGTDGHRLRARVLPLLAKEPTRMPDYFMSGPQAPLTAEIRQRLFGDDR